jgi:hypothetical protein
MAENPYKRKKFKPGGALNESTGLFGAGSGNREGAKSKFKQAIEDRKNRRSNKKVQKARDSKLQDEVKSTRKSLKKTFREGGATRRQARGLAKQEAYKSTMRAKATARKARLKQSNLTKEANAAARKNNNAQQRKNSETAGRQLPYKKYVNMPGGKYYSKKEFPQQRMETGMKGYGTPTSKRPSSQTKSAFSNSRTLTSKDKKYQDATRANAKAKMAAQKNKEKTYKYINPRTGRVTTGQTVRTKKG